MLLIFSINSQEIRKENLKIEWGEFIGHDLSLSNQLLKNSIPYYLLENFDSSLGHFSELDEKLEIFEDAKRELISKTEDEIKDLITKRDLLIFNSELDKEKIKGLESDIELKKNTIEKIKNKRISDFQYSDPIPFYTNEKKLLTLSSPMEIKHYLNKNKKDYFISGSIEEISDNLLVIVKLYSKFTDEVKVVWRGIGDSEDILNYRDEMLLALSKVLISSKVVRFTVITEPENSKIYINNNFKGLGQYSGYFLNKSFLNLSVINEGYLKKELIVMAESEVSKKIVLEPEVAKHINVISIPSGASIYYGSVFYGTTPATLPVYSYPLKLRISLEGYNDKHFTVDNKTKEIKVKLVEGLIDKSENFVKHKENFYVATAVFSFSLAIPLFLNTQPNNIEPVLFNISIGNAIVWGVNLFYQLYSYLTAAEQSVE